MPNEKPSDTEEIIRNFMVEKLDLASDLVSQMKLEKVHRIGAAGQNREYAWKKSL